MSVCVCQRGRYSRLLWCSRWFRSRLVSWYSTSLCNTTEDIQVSLFCMCLGVCWLVFDKEPDSNHCTIVTLENMALSCSVIQLVCVCVFLPCFGNRSKNTIQTGMQCLTKSWGDDLFSKWIHRTLSLNFVFQSVVLLMFISERKSRQWGNISALCTSQTSQNTTRWG